MLNLLAILAVLFLVLAIVVKVLEKYGSRSDPEADRRISRWILPLVALLIVLQLIRYYTGGG